MTESANPVQPVRVRRLLFWVWLAVAAVVGAAVVRETLVAFSTEMSDQYPLPQLRLHAEQTVGAWLSAVLLAGIGATMLLASVLSDGRLQRLYWRLIGIGFFYLSADEAVGFHERLVVLPREVRDWGSLFYFPWVAVGGVAVLAVGIGSIPFLRGLPRRTAVRLLVAGAVYLGGAIGLEMVSGHIYSTVSTGTPYDFISILEETVEMAGIVLGLRAALLHLADFGPPAARALIAP